jgi:hypothetical protein
MCYIVLLSRETLLLVHDSENARQVCRYAVNNGDFRQWLKKYEFTEMTLIVNDWAKLY